MNKSINYKPEDIISFDYYLNDKGQYVFGRVKDDIDSASQIDQSGIFDDSSIEIFIGTVSKARRIWGINSPV